MIPVVSTTFIVLNVPFFIAWCSNYVRFLQRTPVGETSVFQLPEDPTESDRSRGWIDITRTIFFGNYCVNFFIYSLSGAYFRRHLRHCLSCRLDGDVQDGTTWSRPPRNGRTRPIKYNDSTGKTIKERPGHGLARQELYRTCKTKTPVLPKEHHEHFIARLVGEVLNLN